MHSKSVASVAVRSLLLLHCMLGISLPALLNAEKQNALERYFSSFDHNLTCAQCETKTLRPGTNVYYATMAENRECFENPERFLKICEFDKKADSSSEYKDQYFKPRGCAKTITSMKVFVRPTVYKDVKFIKRYCASSSENDCTFVQGIYTDSTTCVCSGNKCNSAHNVLASPGWLPMLSLVLGAALGLLH